MPYSSNPVPEGEFDRRYLDQELRNISDAIRLLEEYVVQLVPAGYAGAIEVADVPLSIPTVTYVTLPVDTLSPAINRGVSFDLVNNEFTFTSNGLWALTVSLNIQGHDSVNSGRSFNIRPYNVTDAIAGSGLIMGIGRNQTDTFGSVTVLVEITQDNVDNANAFRIEVGDADIAITGGTLIASAIQMTFASELSAIL